MVLAGILLVVGLVDLDRSGVVPAALIDSAWLYNGGGTGARTLLGDVASSTFWKAATPVSDPRRGYLQQLDGDGLAD